MQASAVGSVMPSFPGWPTSSGSGGPGSGRNRKWCCRRIGGTGLRVREFYTLQILGKAVNTLIISKCCELDSECLPRGVSDLFTVGPSDRLRFAHSLG